MSKLAYRKERVGKYLSDDGTWVIAKHGSGWRVYLDNGDGRFLRMDVGYLPTLGQAKDWVDVFHYKGMDKLIEQPRHPVYYED